MLKIYLTTERADIQHPFSLRELANYLMTAIDRVGAAQMPVVSATALTSLAPA